MRSRFGRCAAVLSGTGALVVAGTSFAFLAEREAPDRDGAPAGQLHELDSVIRNVKKLDAAFEPVAPPRRSGDPNQAVPIGSCPSQSFAYTDASFSGGTYMLQGGFGEEGIAAISVTVDAQDFPIRIDSTEMIFGTQGTSVTTTTEWSMLVWEGTPDNGNLVAEFSSDGDILPHIVIPPGTNGVNVQVSVDPGDPEQIILQNNGSNTFSFGYRIDKHNNQTSNPCLIPPPSSSNAFPATDTSGLAAPNGNWIAAVDCGSFACVPGGDFITFNDMNALCTPSGDWIMRVNYTPIGCSPEFGACCLPNGTCEVMSNFDCDDADGLFQGANETCANVVCPDPIGACCSFDGTGGCDDLTEAECDASGGAWLGPDTSCDIDICSSVLGGCCIPATGGCIPLTPESCYFADGIFRGVDFSCASDSCFPAGACCLPDGSCIDDISPEDCDVLDGLFQGDETTCDSTDCPLPTAACCLSNGNCLVLDEPDCAIVGGTWGEPGTDCIDSSGDGTADACETDDPCPGDLNDDAVINVSDMLVLLGEWGSCDGTCTGDLNDDDVVNVSDLLILLGAWGDCD